VSDTQSTRTRERTQPFAYRSGSVLLIVALFLPVLFSFTALTVDVGYFYSEKSKLQTLADMAAVSALGNVEWDGVHASDEANWMTSHVANICTANGYPADLFTPQFPLSDIIDSNIHRLDIDKVVPVETFFSRILGWGTVNISIASSAYTSQEASALVVAQDYGIYGLDYVFCHSASAVFETYDSEEALTLSPPWSPPGIPPTGTTTIPLEIGSGREIHFNGTSVHHCSFSAHISITEVGGAGNVIAYDATSPTIDPSIVVSGTAVLGDVPTVNCPLMPGPITTHDNYVARSDPTTASWWKAGNPSAPTIGGVDYTITGGGGWTESKCEITTPSPLGGTVPHVNIKAGAGLILRPGGVYYFYDLTSKGVIDIWSAHPMPGCTSGDSVWIFVEKTLNSTGQFLSPSNKMKIIGCNPDPLNLQTIDITGTVDQYIDLYAPNADVDLSGSSIFYGRIYAFKIDLQATFYFDRSLGSWNLKSPAPAKVTVPVHLIR